MHNDAFATLAAQYGVDTMREAPYPVPSAYIRDLCEMVADPENPTSKGQREAARMLKTSERAVRYWCSDGEIRKECPWAAAELLRRMIIERTGTAVGIPDPADYRTEKRAPPPVGG